MEQVTEIDRELIEAKKEEIAKELSFADALTLLHIFLEQSAIQQLSSEAAE